MKSKKSIIDTYTTMYFIDIVVANMHTTLEELKELYTYADGEELDDDIIEAQCTVSRCKRKSDNKYISLVKYNHPTTIKSINKKLDLINTISHEAGHVAIDIYEYISQEVKSSSSEPFCYLLGYAAECIYKTLTKK